MYVGAHFIGQVLLGAVFGIGTGFIIVKGQIGNRLTMEIEKIKVYCGNNMSSYWRSMAMYSLLFSGGLILIAVVEFGLLSLFMDPLISIKLAREGCEATKSLPADPSASANDENARFQLERGPFMGVMRDAGVAFGLGLAWALVQLSTSAPPSAFIAKLNPFTIGASVPDSIRSSSPTSSSTATLMEYGVAPNRPTNSTELSYSQLMVILLFRAVIGLVSASMFTSLLVWLFTLPPFVWFSPIFPALFIYGKNYFIFAGVAFFYIALAPIIMRTIEEKVIARMDQTK